MTTITRFIRRLRAFVFRTATERDLDREVAFHLERATERNVRLGMSPDEARHEARRVFGPVEVMKETHRDGRGTRWLDDLIADVRHGLRLVVRAPSLSVAAIITLALGIGANTAIFSAVDAVLLKPLPFADPDRLVMLWESNVERGWVNETAAPANVLDWQERVASFDGLGAYSSFTNGVTLTGVGEPRHFDIGLATGNLFRVLGVTPLAGQMFRDEDTWRSGELPVMLGSRMWREVFADDRGVVGRVVTLEGRPARIVGVLPDGFALPGVDADLWQPTAFDPRQRAQMSFRRAHWLRPIARVRRGVTFEKANAELQTVIAHLQQEYPATNTRMGGGFTRLHTFAIGDSRRPLLVLLGAVALLLVIACANIGNLLLVRASGRARETAVRLAMGARRSRLVRQALTESLVLAAMGGAAGLAFGWWGTRLLGALRPPGLLPVGDVSMNWSVLWYVMAITVASGVAFGIAPALWNRRSAPNDALREGARGTSGGARAHRAGELLLVGEIAFALMLSTGAGLLVRTVWKLSHVDAGVDATGVLTARVTLPRSPYDSVPKITAFWDRLTRELRARPGVVAAGAASTLALTTVPWSGDFHADGWSTERYGVGVLHREVTPGYFDAMRVPLRAGRYLDEHDILGSQLTVVINDVLAKQYFPNEDPVGQRIVFDRTVEPTSVWRTIVGVVGSERQAGLSSPPLAEFYVPELQWGRCCLSVVIRTSGDPAAMTPVLREVVSAIDPSLAIANVRTMDDVRTQSAATQRFLTTLLFVFAIVGLSLAVVGVYGVMAHVAQGRVREVGIRVALGARASQVRWLVLRRGLTLAGAGVVAGLAAALVATRALRALLYGVAQIDPVTFVVVPLVLAAAALVACWIPAERVSRTDAMSTLRTE